MMQKVLDIIDKNLIIVDILDGTRRIQEFFYKQNVEFFAVYEDKRLVGVVTKRELVGAHPNRIIADVMSDKYLTVDCYTYIWQVKELFDFNKEIDVILVLDENKIIGFVTRTLVNIELAKHVDVLTGLYKSNYIFYNALKLAKYRGCISIIFIDLNNFGYIDKKYGHISGDIILKNVANILKETITSNSYLCRYAGDEFVILTSSCIADSKLLAENLMNAIESFEFLDNIPVSASVGISGCNLSNMDVENLEDLVNKLINIASLASTKAKNSSENLIIVEDIDLNAIA